MAFTCTTNGGGVELSASTFENIYGKYADWASYKTGVPYVMILIMWFHESGKGKKILTPLIITQQMPMGVVQTTPMRISVLGLQTSLTL